MCLDLAWNSGLCVSLSAEVAVHETLQVKAMFARVLNTFGTVVVKIGEDAVDCIHV